MGDVDQLDVVANLDADGVVRLGDDFVWVLVLWVERRLHVVDLHIDPA